MYRYIYGTEGALDLNKTIITVASATYAAKAQRLLGRKGIPSKLTKINENEKTGCTFGIVVSSGDFFATVGVLKENGISYSVKNA